MRQPTVGAIVVAARLVVLTAIHLVYTTSRPTAMLVDHMYRVANNDVQIDIPDVGRHGEIGDVAQAAARFHENTIELGHNRGTLVARAAVLQEMLDKERRVVKLQRNSVSMASHELRAPLGVVSGQARHLAHVHGALSPEVLGERCEKIRATAQRTTHLMNHLLDSSYRLDFVTPAAMRCTDFSPAVLLTKACEMHSGDTPSAWIELCVEIDEPNTFFGGIQLLFQAFSNLVSNAVECSPLGAPVSVRMYSDGDGASVTVEDRGLGISEHDIERLFGRYTRGGNVVGTVRAGIRFYLVELVVELHQGTITVTSEEGKDLTFSVFLPRLKG